MSVANDLITSRSNISRYWVELRKTVRIREADERANEIPVKTSLWPLLRYKQVAGLNEGSVDHALIMRLWKTCLVHVQEGEVPDSMNWANELGLKLGEEFGFAPREAVSRELSAKLSLAKAIIKNHWEESFDEMMEALWAVVWVLPKSLPVSSSSDPKRFGLIHLNPRLLADESEYRIATDLIHESAHHALYVESAIDKLFMRDWDKPLWSPIRNESRPAIGVLHGLMASYRMLIWASHLRTSNERRALLEASRIEGRLAAGFKETSRSMMELPLTKRGSELVSTFYNFGGIA